MKRVVEFFKNLGLGVLVLVGFIVVCGVAFWIYDEQTKLETGHGAVQSVQEVREENDPQAAQIGALKIIANYCAYGATSADQLEGCYFHVHIGEIEGRDTNAAEWARGDLDECLSDSGPYCGEQERERIEASIDKKAEKLE